MKKSKVVIIEDEIDFLSVISELCQDIGCETFEFRTFEDFIYKSDEIKPDLIITDRNLPGLNGNALIKSIRTKDRMTPIVMISGSLDAEDNIEALSLGANDFITKPFNFEVFLLKVKKFLNQFDIRNEELKFLPDQRVIRKGDVEIILTDVQYRILEILMSNHSYFASREQLHVQDRSRSLDVHINKLRKKLSPIKIEIDTIRNKGYKLRNIG